MDQRKYWLSVRTFHVLFGLALIVLSMSYIQNRKIPKWVYYFLMAVAAGAVAYHGFKLFELIQN